MPTILVVDDEKPICTLMEHLLHNKGYTVITAGSGPEAIEAFRANRGAIDLLISDISMVGMDGPSIVEEIRSFAPALPVLFMSGRCEEEEAMRIRGFEFLSKPFSLVSLLDKVRMLLARSESLV
jgi:two-component system cell cycle sensor histidine kinase/response regulator CckA